MTFMHQFLLKLSLKLSPIILLKGPLPDKIHFPAIKNLLNIETRKNSVFEHISRSEGYPD